MEIQMRTVVPSDLAELKKFFIKSYGENTVFQNEDFLKYYFSSLDESEALLPNSLIILNDQQEIVSHYGGLHSEIRFGNEIIPLIWGVNAYTLKEWRGKGFNSKIVTYIHENNEVNAVIGMPPSAPGFYSELGYNIFSGETMDRYIYVLEERTFEIVDCFILSVSNQCNSSDLITYLLDNFFNEFVGTKISNVACHDKLRKIN